MIHYQNIGKTQSLPVILLIVSLDKEQIVNIPIFPNMMAGYRWSESLLTPTIFRLVYPSKACFILFFARFMPTNGLIKLFVGITSF